MKQKPRDKELTKLQVDSLKRLTKLIKPFKVDPRNEKKNKNRNNIQNEKETQLLIVDIKKNIKAHYEQDYSKKFENVGEIHIYIFSEITTCLTKNIQE